jgi:hypothetical protein
MMYDMLRNAAHIEKTAPRKSAHIIKDIEKTMPRNAAQEIRHIAKTERCPIP